MNLRRSEEWVSMSRFLVGLAAVLVAVPAAVGVQHAAAPAGYAPVVQVSPMDRDDDDGDHHEKKSSTKHRSKHTEDIDTSGMTEEEVAALGTALVVAALAAVV